MIVVAVDGYNRIKFINSSLRNHRIVPYDNPTSEPPTPEKTTMKTPKTVKQNEEEQPKPSTSTPALSLKQRVEMLENFVVVQNKRIEALEKRK